MFDGIFEAIEEWMRELLTGMVTSNLTTMFTDVNEKTGEIAAQVGQTPQGWNGSIFSLIQNLSNSVIVPIAGMIITFVLCYELITMLTEKNMRRSCPFIRGMITGTLAWFHALVRKERSSSMIYVFRKKKVI